MVREFGRDVLNADQTVNRLKLGEVVFGDESKRLKLNGIVHPAVRQMQADLLGIPVVRPAVIETTALGAAYLAGLGSGLYAGLDELSQQWRAERTFVPQLARELARERIAHWERAVRQATAT